MKGLWPLILLVVLMGCTENNEPTIKDFEQAILESPIPLSGNFIPENGDHGYRFFENGNSIGFHGPLSAKFSFDQFISMDILCDGELEIIEQQAYPGRLVQRSKKCHFELEQTLFFSDGITSITRTEIRNSSALSQDLDLRWEVKMTGDMLFEQERKYGIRFTMGNSEIWPHTSGVEQFEFNEDSTAMIKTTSFGSLYPDQDLLVYTVTAYIVEQDSVKPILRCRPWLIFPEEEYWENCTEFGKDLLK
ncbi:MAG: hypothetical protein HKN39_01220 [Flavobacteriales bacterium]|nr:hypothetical protein [Flavobacteriales bacterium]